MSATKSRARGRATAEVTREATRTGIVRRIDPAVGAVGGDLTFTPEYTVTSTDDKGGQVLTDVEVVLVFWGSFWSTTPPPSPSRAQYEQAIRGIVSGPYMTELAQYRSVRPGSVIYSEIYDGTDPGNPYSDADVVAMLKSRFANEPAFPQPAAGHDRFYAVIAPQGVANSNSGLAGQHQSLTYNGVTAWYCWADNSGTLTGHNCVTKVLSHELVEACTNPNVDTTNDSILVQGKKSDGTAVVNDEIGDTCNDQFATVDMNGITCDVQSYWSKAANSCVLPLGSVSFWIDKDTFGKDEVTDIIANSGGKVQNAFWLVVEGFSKTTFSTLHVTTPTPTGTLASIPGIHVAPNGSIDYENAAQPDQLQRIRVAFDITFTTPCLKHFPASGSATYALNAYLDTDGQKVPSTDASALFELVAGADPYFTNIDPSQGNVFYLSQDLRVFSTTPALNGTPVPGGPSFMADSPAGAYSYVQQLLSWLNANYSNTSGVDPFASILPGQAGALTGDSSVTPFTIDWSHFPPLPRNNYQFAVARVRLRGSAGPAGEASNVRVFFRLWASQTADTDYQPSSTYVSANDSAGLPVSPQVGAAHTTIPFFASGNFGANNDYGTNGANTHNVAIATGQDTVWAYFGCFLNVYDSSYVIDGRTVQGWLAGSHHCLVAQIAYDGAPISVGMTPEGSDKLAQRNLQVTLSDNPGPASAHRIPQTFDIRPSALDTQGSVDELMIDWGRIPHGSVASIFWPQVDANEVLELASSMYGGHTLTASGAHTISSQVTGGVTYVPIPAKAGANFAGLLTVDLPTTVRSGEQFDVVVRRLGRSARRLIEYAETNGTNGTARAARNLDTSRRVRGTFGVRIPVATGETMLLPEENTLAIMKWRLEQLTPADRWHPVLVRYVDELAGRVLGLGGDPSKVLPSPNGVPVRGTGTDDDDLVKHDGRIEAITFDCDGRIESFVIADCCDRHEYRTREPGLADLILKLYRERLDVVVFASRERPAEVVRIVVRA